MRSPTVRALLLLSVLFVVAVPAGWAQSLGHPRMVAASESALTDLRDWDRRVNAMKDDGDLRVRQTAEDTLLEGRLVERLDQYYRGVRVVGGDLTRQVKDGLTLSVFGTLFPDIGIEATPALSAGEAKTAVETLAGMTLGQDRRPELVILPRDGGGYKLAYRARVATDGDIIMYFLDANDGTVLLQFSDAQRQAAVGKGVGVLGDPKKISATASSGRFIAQDGLRPPSTMVTFDMKGDLTRTRNFLNGNVSLSIVNDAASSPDNNNWTDGATVDAHVYAGFTYDYYFRRFGRRGLNDNNVRMLSLTHPVNRADVLQQPADVVGTYYLNAFYAGSGVMVYGEGLPPNLITSQGQRWNYLSAALDVVAHELSHGVTDFTSGLIYKNESGALNESFSDMMGTAAEFFFQAQGPGPMQADYLIGEDVITPSGIRSLANPSAFGDPDHYSRRYTGTGDNGGVHINSGIPNHAYYLAIEGGFNRTSGLAVTGVGSANREQIEKVMYRAFCQLMPSNTDFALARVITLQAARDLYGAGSPAERALQQAWTAVGVN